ncbi:uncharacterized protein [Chanodichthys erythropterus]|uniref:uncharacterized protein n=1 Tax=Chanodichthys erythropterus TaxID=933992 RepID=UPI00351ED0EB
MLNNNREKISSVSEQTEAQHTQINKSHHDAVLIMKSYEGHPALYQLNTEKKYIDTMNKKVRQWTYGRRDRKKQNKVILMVGETGAGKTTMINTIINYFLGVKFEDEEFYQITEEEKDKDQSQSQTSAVTVYEVFVEENPTSLTIIDTPGYGDTEGYERDREISEYLIRLFSDEDGIHYMGAVCFVMKASQNRLSGKEHYIFHSVLSLFGKDIENNIVFLFTQSTGVPPTDALNAINKAEIPCRKDEDNLPVHFLFNNQQKEKRDKRYKRVLKSAWEMGDESMKEFFTLLEEKNRKSVKMTLDVLNERRRLEACVSNLMDRIFEKELKAEELNQIKEAISQNRDKIEKGEDFEFTFKKVVKEKVPIENEWWWNSMATCCSVCKENCHEWNCWWVDPEELQKCEVMKDNKCTVCTKKCPHEKHIKEDKKYVTKEEIVSMKFNDLKQMRFVEKSENKTDIEEDLDSDLEKNKNDRSKLLDEAYVTIMKLSTIALKADSAFTLQYLDILIPRLKEERKDEWMKNLEELRKAGEEKKNKWAIQHLLDFSRQKWKQWSVVFSKDK